MLSTDVHCDASSEQLRPKNQCTVKRCYYAAEPTIDLGNEVALQRSKKNPGAFATDVKTELLEAEVPSMYLPSHHHQVAWSDFILMDQCVEGQ